ncbi:MAG: hypothetical protein JOZ72_08565 [Alphaproteobacteria bacterium]|nr:hypothetical protein [Alphaproteobacteria bacterium]
MRFWPVLAFAVPAVPAAAAPLPMDVPVTLGSVETVCTGIGEGKNDPRWKAYPIRVEFADAAAHYIAGAHVALAGADGTTMAELDCSGSWVLFKTPRGLYSVTGRIGTETASGKFQTPMTGQMRLVLRFPSAQ